MPELEAAGRRGAHQTALVSAGGFMDGGHLFLARQLLQTQCPGGARAGGATEKKSQTIGYYGIWDERVTTTRLPRWPIAPVRKPAAVRPAIQGINDCERWIRGNLRRETR